MDSPATQHLKVWIDRNKCVGSTMCIQYAPNVFGLDDRKQSMVIDPEGDTATRIREAAEQCPVCAIVLADAETGEQLFP